MTVGFLNPDSNFLLPGLASDVPDEPIDVTIYVEARIKPWTFNITHIVNETTSTEVAIPASKYETIPAGAGYGETVHYTTIEMRVGYVYRVIFKAIDTDHGMQPSTALKDYFGNTIQLNLPQHAEVSVYFKPTANQIGNYTYACSFFCGTGHGNMHGIFMVTE